jgi:hypothetical protein
MDKPTDRQQAAFDRYWYWTIRLAALVIAIWVARDLNNIVHLEQAVAALLLIHFLDRLKAGLRWLNRRHDPHYAKPPPDAP